MKRYLDSFKSKLIGIDFNTLENSKYSIHCISEELNLIYVNPAWINFARENGANEVLLNNIPLGINITKAFNGENTKNYYTENYLNVFKTGKPWRHEYECSTINEFRKFHQDTYPINKGSILVIKNTLNIKLPMEKIGRKVFKAVNKNYTDSNGFVTQCCNCRCTQRAKEPEIWDWVPDWIENIPINFSHSICPVCFDYYWKK